MSTKEMQCRRYCLHKKRHSGSDCHSHRPDTPRRQVAIPAHPLTTQHTHTEKRNTMAKITQSLDDLNGDVLPEGTPTTTVTITDPRNSNPPFEIDLSDDSLKALLKAVERFRVKGRALDPAARNSVRNSTTDAHEAREARAWAMAHRPDLKVAAQGAVPKRAIDAYRDHLSNADQDGEGNPLPKSE